MRPDEVGFVCNSWKESAKDSRISHLNMKRQAEGLALLEPHTDEFRDFSRDFYTEYNARVQRVMDAPHIVLVAREATRPALAYGWACAVPTRDLFALAYVYTKRHFRQRGIMRELLGETLSYAPDVPTAYCAGSRFDAMFERYGMQYAELSDVLKQARAE